MGLTEEKPPRKETPEASEVIMFIVLLFMFLFRSVVYTVDGQASVGIPESMPSLYVVK